MKAVLRSWRQILSAGALGMSVACASAKTPAGTVAPQSATARNADAGKTLADFFAGKFSGIEVSAVSPNSVKLVVRGAQNFDGSAAYPMYVVDGSPVAAPDGVFSMNPNDILKVEVLKNDATTLVYGQQAVNGVVKITTKRK